MAKHSRIIVLVGDMFLFLISLSLTWFVPQGSESDTIVYVVGSPAYQNWQHVYTAVTRGVRQVLIINNPGSLFKAIKSLPVRRQTKLQEDMLEAMRCRSSIQEYGNTQSANQFRDVQFTSQSFDVKNTTSAYSASEVHAPEVPLTFFAGGQVVFTGGQEVS